MWSEARFGGRRAGDGGPTLVFVLGTGRCGSSLVQEVLARHPAVGFVSNVDDRLAALGLRGRWNTALYRLVPQRFTLKGRLRFAPSEAYRALGRAVSPLVTEPCRDPTADDASPWVAGRFRRFFEERARAQGRPVLLHKFTGWPRAGFIHSVFPEARFIHVVRDGRAVASSLLQMPWWRGYRGPGEWGWGPLPEAYAREWEASGRSFGLLAGLEWKLLMDAFERAKESLPPERWLEVRYEDFMERPRPEAHRMLEFMDLTWGDRFEAGFSGYSFDPSRTNAYARDLSPRDLDLLDRSLEGHLGRLGYGVDEPRLLRSAGEPGRE